MTTTLLNPDEIQVRQAEVTKVADDGTLEARIVPYEVEVELADGLFEVFTRGAFASAVGNPSRCKVTDQGHQPIIIGHATELRDEAHALEGSLRILDTTQGRDVLTLLRGGSLTDLSVEFRMQRRHYSITPRADGTKLLRHDRAVLVGVSPVGAGAYGEQARVLAVREAARTTAQERALAQLHALASGPQRG